MRAIDVVTIFPDYFGPLEVSLLGKARERGLLDVRVHDLRAYTDDVHRSVDDAPYGGGPGMLMRPEPWGRALDAIAGRSAGAGRRAVAGRPDAVRAPLRAGRTRRRGRRAVADRGVRPLRGDRRPRRRGRAHAGCGSTEVSIGDYVLAGGEVAALVIIEAVARLLPGFMGNAGVAARRLVLRHLSGLLEAPAYTRPPSWRDLDVPEVLLSGDHAASRAGGASRSERRTRDAAGPTCSADYRLGVPPVVAQWKAPPDPIAPFWRGP